LAVEVFEDSMEDGVVVGEDGVVVEDFMAHLLHGLGGGIGIGTPTIMETEGILYINHKVRPLVYEFHDCINHET
jgi:hypothetical protein